MLPIMLNNTGNIRVLLVGGGNVALRRIVWLHSGGITDIDLIAPEVSSNICSLNPAPQILHEEYSSRDLLSYTLILACTNRPEVNLQVERDARKQRILCNRADNPQSSDFHVPAAIQRGGITIALNSGVPAYTRKLKTEIESLLPENAALIVQRLQQLRVILQNSAISPAERSELLNILSTEVNTERLLNFPVDCNTCVQNIKELIAGRDEL